jgi:hypothetical protein
MARRKEPQIPDAVLDQLLSGTAASTAFDRGELLDQLKKALAERALNAEMDHHLAVDGGAGPGQDHHRPALDLCPRRPAIRWPGAAGSDVPLFPGSHSRADGTLRIIGFGRYLTQSTRQIEEARLFSHRSCPAQQVTIASANRRRGQR